MSKIDFRLGNLTGRLAGMVGATWKGIDYVRKMVIPANPNTAAQQGTRTVFAWLVAKGRRINSTILKDGIIPTPKKMSAFNKFIANNQAMIDAGVVTVADMVISIGSLYTPPTFTIAADAGANQVVCTWGTGEQGEALSTDSVWIVLWNITKDEYFFDTVKTREDGTVTISTPNTDVADVFHGWLFLTQGTTLATETKYHTDVAA